MSRLVIHDIVIPVVEKIMVQDSFARSFVIQDSRLEEFLEEEMRRHFGVIGANECQHLKEQLEEAKKNDPFAFEFLLSQLLKKYVRIELSIRHSERLRKLQEGPPDRFSDLKKSYPSIVRPKEP